MQLIELLKRNAKKALKDNWSKGIAISLILMALTFLFLVLEILLMGFFDVNALIDATGTPDLFIDDKPNSSIISLMIISFVILLSFAVMSPLKLGSTRWFYNLGDAKSDEVASVLEFFGTSRTIFNAISLYFLIGVNKAVIFMFTITPSLFVVLFSLAWKGSAKSMSEILLANITIFFGIMLLITSVILASIWCTRYFLAPIFYVSIEGITPFKAIRLSKKYTKGKLRDIFRLQFSLLGWYFCEYLVFPKIYTIPYINTTYGIYARYLITSYEKEFTEG